MADAARIRANLERVREQIGPAVEILAAVKYLDADELPALAEAGIELVGENRAQELLDKQAAHRDLFTWDFIGALQSRKLQRRGAERAPDPLGRLRLGAAPARAAPGAGGADPGQRRGGGGQGRHRPRASSPTTSNAALCRSPA